MKKKTLRQLEILLHILTVIILVLKAGDELSRKLYFPAFITLGLAAIVVSLLFFWKVFRLSPKQSRLMCYYIETPALVLTSYVLYLEKKETAASIAIIAALLYPMVGFVSSKKFKKLKKPV